MKTLKDIPNKQLMALLNCSASRASQIRNQHVTVGADTAHKIRDAFGVPLWEINPAIFRKQDFDKAS